MTLFEKLGMDRFFYKDEDFDEYEYDIEDEELDLEYEQHPFFNFVNIIEIIVTGGPRSGKSELVRLASDELKAKNIPVFVVSETAAELLEGNFTCEDDPLSFQQAVCTVQLAKEKAAKEYAYAYVQRTEAKCAVIIYDRSVWDGRAYIDSERWKTLMQRQLGVYSELGNRFVIHLESAAAIGAFSAENNEEKHENGVTATMLDKRLFDIYRSHPLFAHIPAREDYEQKKAEFLKVLTVVVESRIPREPEKKDEN